MQELAKITPGLEFISDNGVGGSIKIRGVGVDFFGGAADQTVAAFVDDFAQGKVGTVLSSLYDIERIEVLRGPQGTLYGKNAPSGAINIWTREPSSEGLGGRIKARVSSWSTYNVEGGLNVTAGRPTGHAGGGPVV